MPPRSPNRPLGLLKAEGEGWAEAGLRVRARKRLASRGAVARLASHPPPGQAPRSPSRPRALLDARGGGGGDSHPPNFTVPALEPPRTQPRSPLQKQQGRERRDPVPAVLYSMQPPQKEFEPREPSQRRHPTQNRTETLSETSAPPVLPPRAPPAPCPAPPRPRPALPHFSGSALLIGYLPCQSGRGQRITL